MDEDGPSWDDAAPPSSSTFLGNVRIMYILLEVKERGMLEYGIPLTPPLHSFLFSVLLPTSTSRSIQEEMMGAILLGCMRYPKEKGRIISIVHAAHSTLLLRYAYYSNPRSSPLLFLLTHTY